MHSPMAVTTTQEPTTTTTTTATKYNHNHWILQQIPNPKTSTKKKKKPQNLQQNPNPTDQSMTKLNQPSTARAVEDDTALDRRASNQWRSWDAHQTSDAAASSRGWDGFRSRRHGSFKPRWQWRLQTGGDGGFRSAVMESSNQMRWWQLDLWGIGEVEGGWGNLIWRRKRQRTRVGERQICEKRERKSWIIFFLAHLFVPFQRWNGTIHVCQNL